MQNASSDSPKSIEVLSLGMNRTATSSIQEALRILGYNEVMHGFTISNRPEKLMSGWRDAMNAKWYDGGEPITRETFDRLLVDNGFVAVTDVCAAYFAEELVEAYPEAKCILVERDTKAWLHSFSVSVELVFGEAAERSIHDGGNETLAFFQDLFKAYFRASTPHDILANAEAVYREHNSKIRRIVPPERLLIYEFGSGWAPLCRYLGKKVPECGFPRLNDEASLREKIGDYRNER